MSAVHGESTIHKGIHSFETAGAGNNGDAAEFERGGELCRLEMKNGKRFPVKVTKPGSANSSKKVSRFSIKRKFITKSFLLKKEPYHLNVQNTKVFLFSHAVRETSYIEMQLSQPKLKFQLQRSAFEFKL